MAEQKSIDLGKVGITPRGSYDETTSYERLDLVNENNGAYLSLQDNNVGHDVTDTAWWFCIVSAEEALAAAEAANNASKTALQSATKADTATQKAAQSTATANAAAAVADTATQKAQTAADNVNAQAEVITPLITLAQQAIKNAEDAYNLSAQTSGVDKFAAIPASMSVECPEECVIGGTVVAEVTLFPRTANMSKVFIPLNYKGEILPNGEISSDEECDVKFNIVSTQNSSLYKTVTVHFRPLEARLTEDGTARTTESGEEIEC
jgi:multidrug efflux pump subunit AcrA (membrane-fusion protein)